MLAGKLVLVVAINYLEVHALIGIIRQTLTRVPHNQHKMRMLNVTSNSLEWLLALRRGISPITPHKSPGDGHKQSPTHAKAPPLLQAI